MLPVQTYLQSFLCSDMYIKYLSDLINIVHLAHDTVVFPQQHAGLLTYLLTAVSYVCDCCGSDGFIRGVVSGPACVNNDASMQCVVS